MLASLLLIACQSPQVQIQDPNDESLRPAIQRYVEEGVKRVEEFFSKPFPKTYRVELLPSRAAFDKVLKDRWKQDSPGPWAVGAAGWDCLYLLTPRVWKTEAEEHDPDDQDHIRRIIAHELTHTYHAQINPSKEFEGMDDMTWLIEGVATYVSGQAETEHKNRVKEAVESGKLPKELATAWSGRYRYAVCGSIVQFVDREYGRAKLIELLKLTKQDEALRVLGTTETKLLESWKKSVSP